MKKKHVTEKDYRIPKKAFDAVMSQYANMPASVHACNVSGAGHATRNPASPSPIDFKVDVETILVEVLPTKLLTRFHIRYTMGLENLTKEEQHVFAKYEQKLGRVFVERGLWPVGSYFISIR